jgi:hypothetical protein
MALSVSSHEPGRHRLCCWPRRRSLFRVRDQGHSELRTPRPKSDGPNGDGSAKAWTITALPYFAAVQVPIIGIQMISNSLTWVGDTGIEQ